MKYVVKGGIWKNTEDEILKSAVMKYGLNQWSRISSLLVRKSAKECKARWYEWLDPSIKKTEWHRDEEEKLLHLSKIFPTQWRTIAPLIGRTPAQCIEKYENLLDRAMGREETDPNDPRRLKAGEIDPNPETKACRPDPIDMDEDEREMLQECRARLANTKGKKAKRKAREKQLEEARRLAQLQKQRELKQAGIDVYRPIKIRGVDYNAEIPFQALVPEGRHETSAQETPLVDSTISNELLRKMEQKLIEEEDRKKKLLDKKRLQKIKQKNLPKLIEQQNQANMQLLQFKDIELPQPQISDAELVSISKYANLNKSESVNGHSLQDNPTQFLVGDYSSQRRVLMSSVRNQQTPLVSDRIMKDAQDAALMRDAQTPLIGSNSVNQTYQAPQTPSLLAKRFAPESNHNENIQKRQKIEPHATPLRDFIHLNSAQTQSNEWEPKTQSLDIKQLLATLPKPQTQSYQVSAEQIEALERSIASAESEIKAKQQEDEEMADEQDRLAALQRQEELQKQQEYELMSSVLKLKLPRPFQYQEVETVNEAEKLIFEQMKVLIENDNFKHPIKGVKKIQPSKSVTQITIEQLQQAKKAISEQLSQYDIKTITEQTPISLSYHQQDYKKEIDLELQKIKKLESAKALNQKQWKDQELQLKNSIQKLTDERERLFIENEVFNVLASQEQKSLIKRQTELKLLVQQVSKHELELQERYRHLKS